MIEVEELSKHFGDVVAVDSISFTVQPGVVTGFLGPNGAGKSTTMRMILGLDRPTTGRARVCGQAYVESSAPLAEIGALLDANAMDKGRTARDHLRCLAATLRIGRGRVDEVLEMVGLAAVADRRAGGFSLGMGQRLGIATALLADPQVLMLDEPVNGLDPDGILWVRDLLTELAAQGRTVLLSSHLMSEMELVAEHLIIIGRGKILANTTMLGFIESARQTAVTVVAPDAAALAVAMAQHGASIEMLAPDTVHVVGLDSAVIGELALSHRIVLHQLVPDSPSLEEAFMELTHESVDYHGRGSVA